MILQKASSQHIFRLLWWSINSLDEHLLGSTSQFSSDSYKALMNSPMWREMTDRTINRVFLNRIIGLKIPVLKCIMGNPSEIWQGGYKRLLMKGHCFGNQELSPPKHHVYFHYPGGEKTAITTSIIIIIIITMIFTKITMILSTVI